MTRAAIAKRIRVYRRLLQAPQWQPWWHEIEVRLFWFRGHGG
jgi:hypothetical protein